MAIDYTEFKCGDKVSNTYPVFRSQIIAVLSYDPVTTFLLSLLITILIIYYVCLYNKNKFYPVFIFHIIAVFSNEDVTAI
jgi:hypothetical protein